MRQRTSSSTCWLARLCYAKMTGRSSCTKGDAAGFKAGVANGHCLINRSDHDAVYLEVGTGAARERADYPDIDLRMERDDAGAR
jgi:uncharacterized cupin superfamily protein